MVSQGDSFDKNSVVLDSICLPPYYGPKDHDDVTPLFSILHEVKPKIVLELGTAHGNTVANICRQITGTKVFTVNAVDEQQTGDLVTFLMPKEEIGKVYKKFGFDDRVVQIYENTLNLDLSIYLDGLSVDLTIIDACHDTEYVINDFLKVEPYVRKNGIVLFHDTHPSMEGHLKGSYLACMRLRRKGYDIRHIEDTWWGYWRKAKLDQ